MASIPLPALHIQPPADPSEGMQRMLALRNMMQETQQRQALMPGQIQAQQQQLQAGNLSNQEAQINLNDRQAASKAMQEWDGKDITTLPGLMIKHGASATAVMSMKTNIIKQQQDLANLSKDQLANEKTKNDYFAQAIDNVKQMPPEQQAQGFQSAVADAVQKGHLDPQQAQSLQYQSPQQLDLLEKTLMGRSQIVEQALKGQQTQEAAAKTRQANAEAEKTEQQAAFAKKYGMPPGVAPDMMEMADYLEKHPGKGPSDYAGWKASLAPSARFTIESGGLIKPGASSGDVAKKFGMTPEAFDQQAEKYWTTGQLPPLGRGISGIALNREIMNRAASLHPEGSLAGNEAAFKANTDSLKKLQTNFDQVSAFENTAGKNLDVFLNTAKKVVDSGSPWINTPLRSVAGQGLGSDDQAAFNAARTTAVTEIAKVLNSANASGVLSDSARHEVSGLIGPNATLKQIYSAANILKQDMANRHQSYQDQIADIQGRISGKQPTATNTPNQGGGAGAITVQAPNGKTYTFPDQDSADSFKKRAGIK